MRYVFADTFYWIGLANPRDEWHVACRELGPRLGAVHIVTTDEVLVEFLTFFAKRGSKLRRTAGELARKIMNDPNTTVLPQTRSSFLAGLTLYETRSDKQYSVTDCISMQAMQEEGLREVLTHDVHSEQEGFVVLLKTKAP